MNRDIPRKVWLEAILFVGVMLSWSARGDGKVFPPTAFPAEIRIPDQTALLIWSNGIERLVIETRFEGKGTDFAWVVPLPSVPVIEPATTGLFTTLRHFFRPEILHRVEPIWAWTLFLGALTWLMLTVREHEPGLVPDVVACALAAVGAGSSLGSWVVGLGVLSAALFATVQSRRGREPIYTILLTVGFVGIATALLLPGLAKAKAGMETGDSSGTVTVIDRKRAGIYETATVTAPDPAALPRWLETNGYAITAGSRPVIEQYAREGWVFVAAKARRESMAERPSALHPLSFTFEATQPVYPLRLTAVGSDHVAVELFVFGPQRAVADGFHVAECRRVRWANDGQWWSRSTGQDLGHPLLRAWAAGGAVATRLDGTLDAATMQKDAVISWEEFREARTRRYSFHGAWTTALNWGMPVMVSVILLSVAAARLRAKPLGTALIPSLAGTALGMLIVIFIFAPLPKIHARLERLPGYVARRSLDRLADTIDGLMPTNEPVSLSAVRRAFAAIPAAQLEKDFRNRILGGPIREEDSPGNFTLRQTAGGVEFIGHDAAGGEKVLQTWDINRVVPR